MVPIHDINQLAEHNNDEPGDSAQLSEGFEFHVATAESRGKQRGIGGTPSWRWETAPGEGPKCCCEAPISYNVVNERPHWLHLRTQVAWLRASKASGFELWPRHVIWIWAANGILTAWASRSLLHTLGRIAAHRAILRVVCHAALPL